MRKILFTLIAIIIMTLTACEKQATTDIEEGFERRESFETTELLRSTELPEEENESIPEEAFDLSGLSPIGALKKVLLSEAPFYCTDSVVNYEASFQGYLSELPFNGEPIITPQFTVLDLDGDAVPEVVLAIDDYYGFVILRYREGKVFGYIVGYRAMHSLKKDGSFWQSSSAFESYISKLFFVENSIVIDENAERIENAVEVKCYLHDVPVDEAVWETYQRKHEEKEDVEWYDFNKESIMEYVIDCSEDTEADTFINERQEYLDTFSYLIELENAFSGDIEENNKSAKQYYYNSLSEVDKIYKAYTEKLSGTELEKLEEEQRKWQEGINSRLARDLYESGQVYSIEELDDWSLYYTYGKMHLKRSFHLVNLYYDCHFYD